MGRRPTWLACSQQDLAELHRLSRSRAEPLRRVERARIILACLSGEPQAEIAERFGTRPNTVSKWRIRFAKQGIAGLADAPRSGKPKTYAPDLRTKLLAVIETPPPKGQARWDGLALAKAVGAKKSTVYALLQNDGIHLQRRRRRSRQHRSTVRRQSCRYRRPLPGAATKGTDRKSTRLNSSHRSLSRMPSSA